MKLKYYLRGVGIGLILAAIIMGIATRSRGREITDAEIMERARKLGMVEAEGTLTDYAQGNTDKETGDGEETDQTGTEDSGVISGIGLEEGTEKDKGGESEIDKGLSAMVQEDQEGTGEEGYTSEEVKEAGESGRGTDEGQGPAAGGEEEAARQAAGTEENNTGSEAAVDSGDNGNGGSEADTGSGDSPAQQEFVNPSYVQVSIPKGVGSDTVCALLERAGVVESASAFNNYLIQTRQDRIIRTGNKTIPLGATYEQIAGIITEG